MDRSQSLMFKSSSLYRSANTTTLVKQTKIKHTMLVMAIVLEVRVSHDPRLLEAPTLVLDWKRAGVRWSNKFTDREAPYVRATHLLAHVSTRVHRSSLFEISDKTVRKARFLTKKRKCKHFSHDHGWLPYLRFLLSWENSSFFWPRDGQN